MGYINQYQWGVSQFFPISHNMMKVVILALVAAAVVLGAPQDYDYPEPEGVREGKEPIVDEIKAVRGCYFSQKTRILFLPCFFRGKIP